MRSYTVSSRSHRWLVESQGLKLRTLDPKSSVLSMTLCCFTIDVTPKMAVNSNSISRPLQIQSSSSPEHAMLSHLWVFTYAVLFEIPPFSIIWVFSLIFPLSLDNPYSSFQGSIKCYLYWEASIVLTTL